MIFAKKKLQKVGSFEFGSFQVPRCCVVLCYNVLSSSSVTSLEDWLEVIYGCIRLYTLTCNFKFSFLLILRSTNILIPVYLCRFFCAACLVFVKNFTQESQLYYNLFRVAFALSTHIFVSNILLRLHNLLQGKGLRRKGSWGNEKFCAFTGCPWHWAGGGDVVRLLEEMLTDTRPSWGLCVGTTMTSDFWLVRSVAWGNT